jgi:hypothetical protein
MDHLEVAKKEVDRAATITRTLSRGRRAMRRIRKGDQDGERRLCGVASTGTCAWCGDEAHRELGWSVACMHSW